MSTKDVEPLVIDRSDWPAGPWDAEPDRVDFKTKVGLPAFVQRNPFGALCGYVGVAKGHPCYGKGLSEKPVRGLNVHGGVSYAEACHGALCHVPEPGEPDDVWWVGFDCGHAFDLYPMTAKLFEGMPPSVFAHERLAWAYRPIPYVRMECEDLAEQLVAMTPEAP